MVDETILRDIKNILKKVEQIKAGEGFNDWLKNYCISNDTTEEEIDELVVLHFMDNSEYLLYKRFLLYKQKHEARFLVNILDSLSEINDEIESLYDRRTSNNETIRAIKDIISSIDSGLSDVPNIRISTAYSRVKNSYKMYFDAYIKSGMKRATFVEGIDKIQNSGIIVRNLKRSKVRRLQKGLSEHNRISQLKVDELYRSYIEAREEYCVYLKEVMISLFTKNQILFNAGVLSLISIYGENVSLTSLDNGIKVVDSSTDLSIDSTYLAQKAFEYFQKKDIPDFDDQVFIATFREFLLHFYNSELKSLHSSNDDFLLEIKCCFQKQREILNRKDGYSKPFDEQYYSDDPNVEEAFELVLLNK